ncbi:ribonuclease H-like protein, partial [Exidia glandulosa HHB12029]
VLESTLAAAQSQEDAMADIFGPVFCDTPEVRVWTDGSAQDTRAGSGVWWGLRARANAAMRITGPQTSDRAEVCGVAFALAAADPYRNLHIFTDSSYAAGMLGPWAQKHAATGWRSCANDDVLKNIVRMVRARHAPTLITWVKSHSGIHGNEQADKWARKGAKK